MNIDQGMSDHALLKVKRQELCNLIKYSLRLVWLSNTALADVYLLANMIEEQRAIAILNIVCKIHDLRISLLYEKGHVIITHVGIITQMGISRPSYVNCSCTISNPLLNNYVTSYLFTLLFKFLLVFSLVYFLSFF